jgi:mRNA interferase RelE/StbE
VAEYKVVVARSARRELEGLEASVARRIIARVEALTTNPRPRGCVKLQGAADLWRIRVSSPRD